VIAFGGESIPMPVYDILVVGGGFGGALCAQELERLLLELSRTQVKLDGLEK